MYIHLGEDVAIKEREIIGIFDLEKTSISKNTKSFLSENTKNKNVINVSYEMPKSFIVADKVYISQMSCSTLKKRISKNIK